MYAANTYNKTSYWGSCKNYQRLALPPTDAFLNMKGCGITYKVGRMVWYFPWLL